MIAILFKFLTTSIYRHSAFRLSYDTQEQDKHNIIYLQVHVYSYLRHDTIGYIAQPLCT